MNISKFKLGDVITRTTPAKNGDKSFIGCKLLFIETVNGTIRFLNLSMDNWKVSSPLLEDFAEGWEYYKTPMQIEVRIVEVNETKFTVSQKD